MIKSILLVSLSLVLVGSILAPSMAFLSDMNIELFGLQDFSEEETNTTEKEIYEKEIILHVHQKHELVHFEMKTVLNGFRQHHALVYESDIFLPPPEHI
jgi:hypothetical protein